MDNTDQPSGNRVIYVFALVFALISLGLQVAGLATLGWLVMDFAYQNIDIDISMGLWQVKLCVVGVCQTKGLGAFWDDFAGSSPVGHEMWEYRIETILGVLFILAAIVCLCKLSCCSNDGIYRNCKGYWVVTCTCSALSAIMSLIAAGKYGRAVADAHNLLDNLGLSPIEFPYSIVITGVGGIVAILVFIIVVIETFRAMNAMNRMNQGQAFHMSPYPTNAQPYGGQPYSGQPYGGQPYGAQPYGGQPYGGHGFSAGPPSYTSYPDNYGRSSRHESSSSKKYPPSNYHESRAYTSYSSSRRY